MMSSRRVRFGQSATTNQLIVDHPNGACTTAGACGFPINLAKKESGFRSRANLTWHITADIMAYYTFSQGFRPGGFNESSRFRVKRLYSIGVAYYCGGPTSFDPRCRSGGDLYDSTSTGAQRNSQAIQLHVRQSD